MDTTGGMSEGGRARIPLDGTWQIVFDEANAGKRAHWERPEHFPSAASESIAVPSCWETVRQDYEGVAWYRRTVDVPAAWADRCVRLCFGAVNYRAEVWLNGVPVGFHEGGYTPFELDVTGLVHVGGENTIVVRVVGPAVTLEAVDDLVTNEAPHWRGAIAGGIWQPAELLATARVNVRELCVVQRRSLTGATVRMRIENATLATQDVTVKTAVWEEAGRGLLVAENGEGFRAPPGIHEFTTDVLLARPILWSPDRPHLYRVEATLESGECTLDHLAVRWGLREFTIRDGRFELNGEPIFLKCAFWEGLYPTTLAFPASADVVREEMRLAREAGFHALRPWRKPPPPPILDLADEMGMLVIDCPPIECMGRWPATTPRLERHVANEITEMVRRDRNHPSVVCWELFNEILRPELARLKHRMAVRARSLDPTRLIVDESGGWAGGAHAYLPFSCDPVPISEIHSYLRSPVDARTYDFYRSVGGPDEAARPRPTGRSILRKGTLLFVSEVGYGALPDLPANCERYRREGNPLTPDYRYHHSLLASLEACMADHGLGDVFPGAADLCRASQALQATGNKLQLEALRTNPHVAGYCLHALTGGDWVLGAGILDLWREPKLAHAAVAEVNSPVYLAIRVEPAVAYAGQSVRIRVTAVNELAPIAGQLSLWLGDGQREIPIAETGVSVPTGLSVLCETDAPLGELLGHCHLRAQLSDGAASLAENTYGFFAAAPPTATAGEQRVRLLGDHPGLRDLLERHGLRCSPASPEHEGHCPTVVAQADAEDDAALAAYAAVLADVERGGAAVLLRPPLIRQGEKPRVVSEGAFPLELHARPALGNWVPVAHVVREHPVLDGLPQKCLMGQPYQNVCAGETIVGLSADDIVGSLSWEWRERPLCYRGPGAVWWGSDLAVVPHGSGRLILSTLRLLGHLGRDPVADTIVLRLASFAASLIEHPAP